MSSNSLPRDGNKIGEHCVSEGGLVNPELRAGLEPGAALFNLGPRHKTAGCIGQGYISWGISTRDMESRRKDTG